MCVCVRRRERAAGTNLTTPTPTNPTVGTYVAGGASSFNGYNAVHYCLSRQKHPDRPVHEAATRLHCRQDANSGKTCGC